MRLSVSTLKSISNKSICPFYKSVCYRAHLEVQCVSNHSYTFMCTDYIEAQYLYYKKNI